MPGGGGIGRPVAERSGAGGGGIGLPVGLSSGRGAPSATGGAAGGAAGAGEACGAAAATPSGAGGWTGAAGGAAAWPGSCRTGWWRRRGPVLWHLGAGLMGELARRATPHDAVLREEPLCGAFGLLLTAAGLWGCSRSWGSRLRGGTCGLRRCWLVRLHRAYEPFPLGLAADAVSLGVLDRRGVALDSDPERDR
jgi:hypothetical protein